ncbi:MAG: 3-methyl-2-oxobutanoate hydroxymethyltransferase [Candidatus Edwardsbacteria bacterium]
MPKKKITPVSLIEMKRRKERIAALTAYDYLTAAILDEIGIEVILVGDSASMVYAGYENTLPITLTQMLYHTQAVARGAKNALVITDMPFLSFQTSVPEAIRNAGRCLKEGGAQAVKIEGGQPMVKTVKALVERGIPVMGHLGLMPQSVHRYGGYPVQARDKEDAERLLKEAKMLEQAGCFSLVLEKIPWKLAKEVTEKISIPTIGIGAGPYCDGQVLVIDDMLGRFEEFVPKFAKRYAQVATIMRQACKKYKEEVKSGKFPTLRHSFS